LFAIPSPLILLAKIHRLNLLTRLYQEIIVPVAVLDEVRAKPSEEVEQIGAIFQDQKFQLGKATGHGLEGLPLDLGIGELEAIALAMETNADLVILDDLRGRRIARENGLAITGTIGVLVEAKERGIIPSVIRELDNLIEAGMWISEAFYRRLSQREEV
jgi:uncharacterized protein